MARTRSPVRRRDEGRVTALWLLVLSPAVVLPGGLDRFVLVKVLAVAVGLLVAVWAPASGKLPRWATVGLAVGACLLCLAALTAAAPFAQLLGRWPRFEGVVALPAYAGAVWAGARLLGPGAGSSRARALVRAVSVLVAAVGGVALLEALGAQILSSDVARSGSLLGNATELGIVGMLAAAVLLPAVALPAVVPAVGRQAPSRWMDGTPARAVALGLAVVTVALSGSRGALLGLVAATVTGVALLLSAPVRRLAIALPHAAGRRGSLTVRLGVTGAAVVLVAVLAVLAAPGTASRVAGTSPAADDTVVGRQLLWAEALDLVADHPLVGAGPSGYVELAPEYHTATWATTVGPADPPDSPHSWPLQAASAGGVGLLVLAVALAALGLGSGVRAIRALPLAPPSGGRRPARQPADSDLWGRALVLVGALAAVTGYGVAAATHFTSPGTTPLAALLGGALCAAPVAVPPPTSRVRSAGARRRVATAVLAVWIAVLVPAVMAEWQLAAAYRAMSAGDLAAGGGADTGFRRAQSLRLWDGDVAVMAAHAFATVALAGRPDAAPLAQEWADRALDRIPSSALALAARSGAAEAAGDLAGAAADMTALVDREPTNAEWRLRRGVIRAQSGDAPAAERDFRRAAELAPDDAAPWRNLEVLRRGEGDEAGATEAAREAARRSG